MREGNASFEATLERIILRHLSDRDEGLTHEILAEAHRNPQVAILISDFCRRYREIFAELVKLAHPKLAGTELEGAAELLLACLFGLSHRKLTGPKLDKATTTKVTTSLILEGLGGLDKLVRVGVCE